MRDILARLPRDASQLTPLREEFSGRTPSPSPGAFVRLSEVMQAREPIPVLHLRVGLRGSFPASLKPSDHCVRWRREDLEACGASRNFADSAGRSDPAQYAVANLAISAIASQRL
jgi:hypothetical protein